jgi:hypothetical protein
MSEGDIGFSLGIRLWGARGHERMAAGLAVWLTRSFDEELHMVHTRSLESKRRKASLATEGGATCTLSKDWQDWRTLTRNQFPPGHSPHLAGLVAGPYCGQLLFHQQGAMCCGHEYLIVVVDCSLKSQVRSSLICFRWRYSQCWYFAPARRHLQRRATVCHAEPVVVSTGGSLQLRHLYLVRRC